MTMVFGLISKSLELVAWILERLVVFVGTSCHLVWVDRLPVLYFTHKMRKEQRFWALFRSINKLITTVTKEKSTNGTAAGRGNNLCFSSLRTLFFWQGWESESVSSDDCVVRYLIVDLSSFHYVKFLTLNKILGGRPPVWPRDSITCLCINWASN